MRPKNIVYVLLLLLVIGSTVKAQPGIFEGGIAGGFSNGSRIQSSCFMVTVSPFSGGFGGGYDNARFGASACAPGYVDPYSGGISNEYSYSQLLTSVCAHLDFDPFSGGEADGYADAGQIISNCAAITIDSPTITFFPSSACAGTRILLGGTGFTGISSISFNGSNTTNFTINSDTTISVLIPSAATTGPISVSGVSGSATSSGDITITGITAAITMQPADENSCELQPVSFSINAGGSPILFFQWRKNGINIPGADSSSYLINAVAFADSGNYDVVVTNTCGSDTSIIAVLNVGIIPSPQLTTSDTIICPGDSLQVCTQNTFSLYTWNTGDVTACTYAKTAGSYLVTVTSADGCSAISAPLSISAYHSNAVSITVNGDTLIANGNGTFQWYINGLAITGETNREIIARQDGLYQVWATDANGCIARSPELNFVLTNIHKPTSIFDISFYPNPNLDGIVQMWATANLLGEEVDFYNVNGQRVFKAFINDERTALDISRLQAGFYFARVLGLVRRLIIAQ